MKRKVTWAEAPRWQKIFGGAVVTISIFIFGGLALKGSLDLLFPGSQVCTVDSARLRNSSGGNGGASPSRSVRIESSDCGLIVITSVRYSGSEDMNEAALVEFLQANEGKRFEFITDYIQFPGDVLGSQGISSTEPVE